MRTSPLGKCVDCEREANTHNIAGDPSCMPCAAKRWGDSDEYKRQARELARSTEADAIVSLLAALDLKVATMHLADALIARARLYVKGGGL